MPKLKIILFNGPPQSGKDTAAELTQLFLLPSACPLTKFAYPLKHMTHRLFGLDVRPDHFETQKDQPLACFWDKTPRECYIAVSELLMKSLFGKAVWARALIESIADMQTSNPPKSPDFVLVSDLGFQEEIDLIHTSFPDTVLVQIARPNCDFSNDSRSYVSPPPGVPLVRLDNSRTKQDLEAQIKAKLLPVLSAEIPS